MQCKYIGDGTDQWLPKHKRCEWPVDIEADKDQPSKVIRYIEWIGNATRTRLIALFPSKKCDHGLCSYHARKKYYGEYFKRFGQGR